MSERDPRAQQAQILDDAASKAHKGVLDSVWRDALRAGAAALRATSPVTWQPIETAPKDGEEVLGWFPYYAPANVGGSVFVMRWNDEKYHTKPRPYWEASGWVWGTRDQRSKQPTRWMPKPQPPSPVPAPQREDEQAGSDQSATAESDPRAGDRGVTQQLFEALAQRVCNEHDSATHWPKGSKRGGHSGEMFECSHADCRLIAKAAGSKDKV